jgi:hypothetical protein
VRVLAYSEVASIRTTETFSTRHLFALVVDCTLVDRRDSQIVWIHQNAVDVLVTLPKQLHCFIPVLGDHFQGKLDGRSYLEPTFSESAISSPHGGEPPFKTTRDCAVKLFAGLKAIGHTSGRPLRGILRISHCLLSWSTLRSLYVCRTHTKVSCRLVRGSVLFLRSLSPFEIPGLEVLFCVFTVLWFGSFFGRGVWGSKSPQPHPGAAGAIRRSE